MQQAWNYRVNFSRFFCLVRWPGRHILPSLGILVLIAGCSPFQSQEYTAFDDAVEICPGQIFSQAAIIFEHFTICASRAVGEDKLVHAANVAAKWLDNDGDGKMDEPRLVAAFAANKPYIIMTEGPVSFWQVSDIVEAAQEHNGQLQDLSAEETDPEDRRDASQEEIHHLIMTAGYGMAFPDIFAPRPGSTLYGIWQKADREGIYSYGDPTCDEACKTIEFVYLASAAYLGSQEDLFSDEMRIKTRAELQERLPEIIALFESEVIVYPRHIWPDGRYDYPANIVYQRSISAGKSLEDT